MRAKSLVLLVVALGCGMIAAVAVSKAVMSNSSGEVEATAEIFVAVETLSQGQKITAETVKLEKWPKNRLPEGVLYQLEQLENQFTKQMIVAGEPILAQKINPTRKSFSTGIPPGHRIFDIPGSAGYIKPGDHVDILGTFQPGGRGRRATPESRTVMRNVKVHGINGNTIRDSDDQEKGNRTSKGTVFQLLVKESQLEALTLANKLGTLQLNLRPFGEGEGDTDTDNGESFLSWIKESEAVEPVQTIEPPILTRSLDTAFQQNVPSPKKTIRFITPNGVKTYEYGTDSEVPKEVVDEPKIPARSQYTAMQANGDGSASGNVYSGYGSYPPTYPTSTSPSAPTPGVGTQPPAGNATPPVE